MRLSSLLFIIFVGITCVLAAIVPQTVMREVVNTAPAEDTTSRLGANESIGTLDLNSAPVTVSIEIVDTLSAPEIFMPAASSDKGSGISIAANLYSYDTETGTLKFYSDCSGHISIKMPQSTLLSITGITDDTSLFLIGLDTPILALDAMPGVLNIDRSVINTLMINGEMTAEADKNYHIILSDSSDIDAIVTTSDEQLSMTVNNSRVGTTVTI